METHDNPQTLDLRSNDAAADKRSELLRIFPEVRTESGRIDFERLSLTLTPEVIREIAARKPERVVCLDADSKTLKR